MKPASAFLVVSALLVGSCAASCSSPQSAGFVRAMTEADAAATRGDRREAARCFGRAADVADRPQDRDEARLAAARELARAGDVDVALARLQLLAEAVPPGTEAGSAFYEAASLRLEHGDEAEGWRCIEAMVRRFPNDGNARPALRHWLQHLDNDVEGGPRASLAWLRKAQPDLDATDRAEEVAFEIARRLDETGETAAAREAFVAVAARWPYPLGALWDDALFRASALDERLDRPQAAIDDLKQMLRRRERAILVGSAERSHYAEAQLHLGEIYRDRLHDDLAARAAFHALYEDYPDSTLRDRGLYEEAELLRADGDASAACGVLDRLVREAPESRYAACAVERCPSMHARPNARAAASCRPYLERLDRPAAARAQP
jgi:tetratricopeptide (TPR) repeat protein